MPLPSGVRLRESCEACTISKVKCSKDKPSCKRCTERGSTCQYMVTQKTGRRRRQDSAKGDVSPPQQQPITPTSLPGPLPLDANAGYAPYCGPFGEPLSYNTGSDEFLSSLSATTDFSIPTIPSLSHYGEVNPQFERTFDGFWMDDFSLLHSDSFTSTSASSDAGDPMAMEYSLSCDISPPPTSQPTINPASMTKITGVDPAAATGIAIQLLEDLNSQREDIIIPADGSAVRTEEQITKERLEQLISKNRQVLQTIATILNPIGSQDGYVLVIICLILHKIVSTYAAVLQCEHGAQCFKTCVIPSTFYEENPAALRQLVDELFQVRSSVSLVGKTIRLAAERSDALRTDNDAALNTTPISITTLISMHEGLRKRLSVLSLRSIEGLKKFWA